MQIPNKLVEDAIIFATECHRGQVRKGNGRPYILHPIEVMLTLYEFKPKSKNANLLFICSLLHDVVEDCGVTLQTIAEKFGYMVASIVEELTSDKDEIQKVGKAEYILQKMIGMSSYALTLKLIDRYRNIKEIDGLSEESKLKMLNDTKYIINQLRNTRILSKTQMSISYSIQCELNHIFNTKLLLK